MKNGLGFMSLSCMIWLTDELMRKRCLVQTCKRGLSNVRRRPLNFFSNFVQCTSINVRHVGAVFGRTSTAPVGDTMGDEAAKLHPIQLDLPCASCVFLQFLQLKKRRCFRFPQTFGSGSSRRNNFHSCIHSIFMVSHYMTLEFASCRPLTSQEHYWLISTA